MVFKKHKLEYGKLEKWGSVIAVSNTMSFGS